MTIPIRLYVFFKVCLIVFGNKGELDLDAHLITNEGFYVKNDTLYYINGKTTIKIKEHFSENNITALDLLENAIKYDMKAKAAV